MNPFNEYVIRRNGKKYGVKRITRYGNITCCVWKLRYKSYAECQAFIDKTIADIKAFHRTG